MTRHLVQGLNGRLGTGAIVSIPLLAGLVVTSACSSSAKTATPEGAAPAPIAINTTPVVEQPITRFIRVTGTLAADEEASVSAEISGRVVGTPVERGSRVAAGSPLVRISPVEADAQLREAEANAGQIEARLAIGSEGPFDLEKVPEVLNARAAYALAQAEFARIQSLLDQRVVSQSEYDQRRTQVDVARQQYESAKNSAGQQFQALLASRARVALARKAVADTSVNSPFAGQVAERRVSVGDYVTRGTVVATVVRVTPLRVQLTVPEQSVAQIKVGQPVRIEVDTYPGKQFTGSIRYVSPSLRAEERAMTVEAVVPNEDAALKPGFFATAEIELSSPEAAMLVPADAIQTQAGTSRVYVVRGDHVEAQIVTIGQTVDGHVEVTRGLASNDVLAVGDLARLADGTLVKVDPRASRADASAGPAPATPATP